MKLLFVHRVFPGQFVHLLRALVQAGHEVVFIMQDGPDELRDAIPGVRVVTYLTAAASGWTHVDAQAFDAAMRRAAAVAEVAAGLRAAGFRPDVVIGHEGWGETLHLAAQWPGVPSIGFREYFYHLNGADVGHDPEFPVTPAQENAIRAKNAVGLLALAAGGPGVSPTRWQRSLYPAWAQPRIAIVPDGVDLAACCPPPSSRATRLHVAGLRVRAGETLVTFVARDLEPYRGFHTFMRALPAILARPGVRVVCVGGDGVSYGLPPVIGTWRARLLAELGPRIDLGRVHFPGRIAYADHLRLLRRSDVHCYLSYPFIASWSLREALACGCAVVAADTAPVREMVSDGETGVLVPPLDPPAAATAVLALLDDPARRIALGHAARSWAERHLTLDAHLAAWRAVINAALVGDRVGAPRQPPEDSTSMR